MTSNSNTLEIINILQSEIKRIINPLFPENGKFALVDFPDHSNVGDSAIWLGEIEYFKNTHKAKPSYVSKIDVFSGKKLKNTMPSGTIFIQGGGNFGDLWIKHQNFREMLLSEFKDYKIVQLPQSIHFSNDERLKESSIYINAHPDFTLLVRDEKSFKIAREHYKCKIFLCPDMAFFMGQQTPPKKPEFDLFCLMRTDKEKVKWDEGAFDGFSGSYQIEDWLEEEPDLYNKIKHQVALSLPFTLGVRLFNKSARRELLYRRLAENRVARGLGRLSSGKMVITDRLHAHILSLLLDIEHIRLDNNYGKISGFAEAWTKESTIAQPEVNIGAALGICKEKLQINI